MDELMTEGMTDEEWARALLRWARDGEDTARRARSIGSRPEWVASLWLSAAASWDRAAQFNGGECLQSAAYCLAVGQAILLGH